MSSCLSPQIINMPTISCSESSPAGAAADLQQCFGVSTTPHTTHSWHQERVSNIAGHVASDKPQDKALSAYDAEALAHQLSLITTCSPRASQESPGARTGSGTLNLTCERRAPKDKRQAQDAMPHSPAYLLASGTDASDNLTDNLHQQSSKCCGLAPRTPDNRSLSAVVTSSEYPSTEACPTALSVLSQPQPYGRAASTPPAWTSDRCISRLDQTVYEEQMMLATGHDARGDSSLAGKKQDSRTLLRAMSESTLEMGGRRARRGASDNEGPKASDGCSEAHQNKSNKYSLSGVSDALHRPPTVARDQPLGGHADSSTTRHAMHELPGLDHCLSSLLSGGTMDLSPHQVMNSGAVLEVLAALQAAGQGQQSYEIPNNISYKPAQPAPALNVNRSQQMLEALLASQSLSASHMSGLESLVTSTQGFQHQNQQLERPSDSKQQFHQAQQLQPLSTDMLQEHQQQLSSPMDLLESMQQHHLAASSAHHSPLPPGYGSSYTQGSIPAQGHVLAQNTRNGGWQAAPAGSHNLGPAPDMALLTDLQQLSCLSDIMAAQGMGHKFNTRDNFSKHHSLYKTELCRSWSETGTCRYGTKCQFAHGEVELRPVQRHPKYKTEMCRTFAVTGSCPYGTRCRFIHCTPTAPSQQMLLPPFAAALTPSSTTVSKPFQSGLSCVPQFSLQQIQPHVHCQQHSSQPDLSNLAAPFLSGFAAETDAELFGQGHPRANSFPNQLTAPPPQQQACYVNNSTTSLLGHLPSAMQRRDQLSVDAVAGCRTPHLDSMMLGQEHPTLPHSTYWYQN